ncbi:YgaP family membrane protein [Sulfitobacter sediminilitoris]|uniref:YgaP family membrane protein n=1 Tax=Sulfitobacter sediminilitoris TaxID=2698830 RepID=UPI001953963F|nr:DUF2892 domain-containing protein [Sulfitobacter sediminilitoris]
MSANVGNADRLFRLVVGIILLLSPLLNMPAIWSSSGFAYASMAVGVILIATSLFRFCPLYRLIGVSTCKL